MLAPPLRLHTCFLGCILHMPAFVEIPPFVECVLIVDTHVDLYLYKYIRRVCGRVTCAVCGQ